MEAQCLELLESRVLSEKQSISVSNAAREIGMDVVSTRKGFLTFIEQHKDAVEAIYSITGKAKGTEGLMFQVAKQSSLEGTKQHFEAIDSEVVYGVAPSQSKEWTQGIVRTAEEPQQGYSGPISFHPERRARRAHYVAKTSSSKFADSKNGVNTAAQAYKSEAASKPDTKPSEFFKTESPQEKAKAKQGGKLAAAFGRQNSLPKVQHKPSTTAATKEAEVKETKAEEKDADMEKVVEEEEEEEDVDMDEEGMHGALYVRQSLGLEGPAPHQTTTASREETSPAPDDDFEFDEEVDEEVIEAPAKTASQADEEEEEDIVFSDSDDEGSEKKKKTKKKPAQRKPRKKKEPEEEKPKAPTMLDKMAHNSAAPVKRKKKVLRTKTFTDEHGYLVTEDVWEEVTDDEAPAPAPPIKPQSQKPKIERQDSVSSTGSTKKSAKQTNLMSFFKK